MGNYFSFDGRIGRRTYLLAYVLPSFAACFAAAAIDRANGHVDGGLGPLATVAAFALLLPFLAGTAKRFHDRGKSAWWLLLPLVPVIGIVWTLIELGCQRGTWGGNKYGGDPLSTRWSAVA